MSRRSLGWQAGTGAALILVGAMALLWLVFDDRLPARAVTPTPDGVALWAVVRVGAGIAIAAGAGLLATALVNRRRLRQAGG